MSRDSQNHFRQKVYWRLGIFASVALLAMAWSAGRAAFAIPIPIGESTQDLSKQEIKSLLTFPEGIPLGGLANFQGSGFLGEQLLKSVLNPAPQISAVDAKYIPVLDATVHLETPAALQQLISTL